MGLGLLPAAASSRRRRAKRGAEESHRGREGDADTRSEESQEDPQGMQPNGPLLPSSSFVVDVDRVISA